MEATIQELADRWTANACKLHGYKARISGRLCDFATIRTLHGQPEHEATFSWQAVDRIMKSTQEFEI